MFVEKIEAETEQVATLLPAIVDEGDDDTDAGAEIESQFAALGRPRLGEWVSLDVTGKITVTLVDLAKLDEGFEQDLYYVAPTLRPAIDMYLKKYTVIPYYTHARRRMRLWVLPRPDRGGHADNVLDLFELPQEHHNQHAYMVYWDRVVRVYRTRVEQLPSEFCTTTPVFATRPTADLLSESLGPTRYITTPDHPAYRRLRRGR